MGEEEDDIGPTLPSALSSNAKRKAEMDEKEDDDDQEDSEYEEDDGEEVDRTPITHEIILKDHTKVGPPVLADMVVSHLGGVSNRRRSVGCADSIWIA